MRKFLALFLSACTVLSLTACGSKQNGDKIEEAPLDVHTQRQIYFDAVKKTGSMTYLQYDCNTNSVLSFPNRKTEDSVKTNVKTINPGDNEARYHVTMTDDNEVLEYYYTDGMVYLSGDNHLYKSGLSEDEFRELTLSQIYAGMEDTFDYVSTIRNEDGTFTVELCNARNVPSELAEILESRGLNDAKLLRFTGKAEINDAGYLISQTFSASVSCTNNDEQVTIEHNTKVNYESPGQKFALPLPGIDGYADVENIDVPVLIHNAYSKLFDASYDAKYTTLYRHVNNKNDREDTMDVDYSLHVSNDGDALIARDKTDVKFSTSKRKNDVERSSEYKNGICKTVNSGKESSEEMDINTAKANYYYMLLDYKPNITDLQSANIEDKGSYIELKYEYTDKSAMMMCQSVLTTLTDDKKGLAVRSENYTIESAEGVIQIDKATGALLVHEISINVNFKDNHKNFNVVLEHDLNVDI